MDFLIGSVLTVFLVNILVLLHYKHLRRVAEARLEIARTVTEMETMMLDSRITLGDICHDKMHRRMVDAQFCDCMGIRWNILRRPTKEWMELRERLHKEISANTELGKLLSRHCRAVLKAFGNQRPFASIGFCFWVLTLAGGLALVVGGFFAVSKIRDTYRGFKNMAAEFLVCAPGMPQRC